MKPNHRGLQLLAITLLLSLAAMVLSGAAPDATGQGTSDLTVLSHNAFTRLADVYRSGGAAPELVAKLNVALTLIQDAKLKRAAGDETNARRLEEQARSAIEELMNRIPAAERTTQSANAFRTYLVLISIPVSVAGSTFSFYVILKVRRWYERSKLYEMRIVAKKKES